MDSGCIDLQPMAIDRPEMLGDGFVEREDGRRISAPAFIELSRAVLGMS